MNHKRIDVFASGAVSFKRLIEVVMEGIGYVDDEEIILYCNPAFVEIFEAESPDDIIGRSVHEFLVEDQRLLVRDQLEDRRKGKSSQYELRIKTLKGNDKTIFLSASPVTDADGEYSGTLGIFFDISRLKTVEEEKVGVEARLQEREERYRALFNDTNDGVFIFSTDDIHLEVNQKGADLLGYAIDEIVGSPISRFTKSEEHPDGHEKGQRLFAGEKVPIYERTFVRKDGSEFPGEINIALIRDEAGNPLHFHSIVRDVTERKETERRLKRYSATQEILFREVNHRVKNNLASIMGILRMEIERQDRSEGKSTGQVLTELSDRIRGLLAVHTLLSDSKWEPIPLTRLCRDIVDAAREGLPSSRKLKYRVSGSQVKIDSDLAHHLAWVIAELVGNSIKHAVEDGGDLNISMRIGREDGDISLEYADNGRGYPEAMIRGESKTRGIGFDLILGIITHLRGTIDLRNDGGAVARLTFANR